SEDEREEIRERNESWAAMLRHDGVGTFMEYFSSLPTFSSQKNLPENVQARIMSQRLSNDGHDLAYILELSGAQRQAPYELTLLALKDRMEEGLPVMYVSGVLDPKYDLLGKEIAGKCSGVSHESVPDAGHNVHLEQPDLFAELVMDFMKEGITSEK
ncbi:MAG: hypothetical protein LUB61_06135, partial [Eggerthellaceae bacterium]|nr:hypothetical protein [Eggerthellaceae bacterium]